MKFQPDLAVFLNTQELADDFVAAPSVIKILSGALDAIADRGVRRLSMSDIVEASGVSRGTLYKYFSNKDEVLAAVAEYVCVGFEKGIEAAAAGIHDPIERLRSVLQFYSRYTNENSPDRVFEVEPQFHLTFFRSRFSRYKTAVREALDPVFDHFDRTLGEAVNRDAFVETLVRLQLSTLLVPADETWARWLNQSGDDFEKWALRFARQIA